MKLLIVLALFGAALALPNDVEPIELPEVAPPENIDFGMDFIPESVAREMGLDSPVDVPMPVHFINENGDIQTYVEESPVDAPVDDSADIAPVELEPVKVVDIADFDPSPFQYDIKVDEPVIVDAPESEDYLGKLYDDPTWR